MNKNEDCTICVYLGDLKTNKFYHEIVKGIKDEASTKNVGLFFTDDLDLLIRTCNELGEHVVAVVEYSRRKAHRILRTLSEHGIHCILVNMRIVGERCGLTYSSVCHDYEGVSRRLILENCRGLKKKIAYLGYNEDSYSDTVRYNVFKEYLGEGGDRYDVYPNLGNVQECLRSFLNRIGEYDSVICANDIFILLMFTNLRTGYDLHVIGSSFLNLTGFCCTDYTTVLLDNRQVGKCVVQMYRFLCRADVPSSVDVRVEPKIVRSHDVPAVSAGELDSEENFSSNLFFDDEQVSELLKLENMFTKCDETDVKILKAIKSGKTYAEIEGEEYIAINTIKYRLNRMVRSAGADGKKRLFELLEKYHLLQ